ncbi:MAG: hypothetical protein ACE5IK_12090 [Acidobacteriota bacterium]
MRRSSWVTLAGLVVLVGILAWTTLHSGQVECEICMSYEGRLECAAASASDQDTAISTATDMACAALAAGRAASMECRHTPPQRTTCR